MSGFVQAVRGLVSRVARLLAPAGAIRPAAWALALMALATACALAPGAARAQSISAPAVTGLSPDAGPTAGGNTVVIAGTDLTGATAVNFGASPAASFVVNSATQITATAPAGTGQVQVRVTTPGGTSAEVGPGYYSYVSVPTLTAVSPASGPDAGGTRVELTGSGFFGSTVLFDGVAGTDPAVFTGSQMYITTPAGAAGTVDVQVVNAGGSATLADAFTYVAAPSGTLTITGAPGVLATGNQATITVTPSFAPPTGGLTVQLTAGGSAGGTLNKSALTFTNANPQTFIFTAASPAGVKTIQYSLSGADAGAYAAPATTSISVGTAGVAVTGAPSSMTVGEVATITVTPSMAPPNGDLTLTLSKAGGGTLSTSVLTFASAAPQTFTFTATAPTGPVSISLVRGGADSLAFAQPAGVNISVAAALIPTISAISPAQGSASAPAPVTISGSNFSASGNSVTFGGAAGTITAQSATSITVTPPTSATEGLVDVVLTTSGNQSVTQGDGYRYLLPPTLVAAFSPATAGVNTTGTFQLTFTNPNSVAVSGLTLSNTQYPTGLTLLGASNGCNNGTSTVGPNGFQIYGGSIAANASCTVRLGARSTTTGAYSVTTGVPSITGPVSVVGLATSTTTPLTFVPVPTIATVTPDKGPQAGGTSITITGTNLNGATAVSIGGSQATSIVVASDGLSLTATTAASSFQGNRSVTVTTPGGIASGLVFNYVPQPTVTTVSPASGPAAGGAVVTISGSNFSDATAVTFQGVAATSFTVDSDASITATTPAGTAGVAPVAVTATGGTGTRANGYTYVAPPTAPVVAVPANGASTGAQPTYSGAFTNADTTITVYVDGSSIGTVTPTSGVSWSLAQPTDLAAGSHTVYATATTPTGGVSAPSTTIGFIVDTTAPAQPTITTPANGATTADNTPTFEGSAEANSTVSVVIDGSTAGTTVATGGAWSFTAATPLAEGSHTVRVEAADAAGNVSDTSATTTFIVNTIPPAITGLSVNRVSVSHPLPAITVTGTGFTGATALTIDGEAAGNFVVVSDTAITAMVRYRATSGTVQVRVVGPAGTSADAGAVDDLRYVGRAVVTGVSPAAGSSGGGNELTITGVDFIDVTYVSFAYPAPGGGTYMFSASNFTVDSDTQLRATMPDRRGHMPNGGTVDVVIRNMAGENEPQAGAADDYVLVPPPSVTGVSTSDGPVAGPLAGGTRVTVTGSRLDSVTGVTVGGAAATSLSATPAELSFDSPAGTGSAPIVLTWTYGTVSTFDFTYVPPPVAPTFVSAPPALSNSRDASFSASGVGLEISLDAGGFVSMTPQPFTFSGLADGEHTVSIRSVSIGGTGPAATHTWTIDATAPAAPVIAAPVDGSVTDDGRPTISGTAEAGSTVQLTLNGAAPVALTVTGGAWSYTPTTDLPAGQNALSAVAVDAAGNVSPASATVRFTYSPVTITTTTVPSGQVGVIYAATIQVSGGSAPYSFTVTSGALPGGLTLSGGGALSGTPTASGNFAFTVTATDANGLSASQALDLVVVRPAEPEVTDVDDVEVTANPGGSGEPTLIDLSGSVRNATRIEIVTPPAHGVATVSGFEVTYTPNPGYFGPDSFTYRAVGFADGGAGGAAPAKGGSPASAVSEPATVSIIIASPTLTLSGGVQPPGQIGVAYSRVLTTSGGTAPYTYAVTAGALPVGISLDADGTLSGSPTAGGTFSFTITATDSSTGTGPFSVSAVHDLIIAAPTLVVTPAALPDAVTAQPYSQAFSTTGGVAPYSYAVTAGALPAGLTLSSAGVLSGTPTQGGSFAFTVTATDASTGAGPYSASQATTLTVTASAISVAPTSLVAGTRGTPYSATVTGSGGVAPYSYTIATGALPAGLTLSTTGQITGTPTVVGTFAFQVRATDSASGAGPYSGVADVSLTIASATLTVTPATLPDVLAGVTYSQQLQASGGQGGYSFAVTTGTLPDGLSLSAAGLIAGKPTTAGVFTFTVTATDGFGNTGSAALSVTVTGRPDPGADPDVRGLNSAQAEATRRMVDTQIGNFGRRLEQLHRGAAGQEGLSLNLSVDGSAFTPLDENRQSRGELAQMLGRNGAGRAELSDREELNRMVWGDQAAAAAGTTSGERRGAAPQQGGGEASNSGLRVWAGGAISLGERDATTQTAEMSISTSGVSAGVDMSLSDTLDLGVGVGFGQENVDVGVDGSRLEADSWVGVAYGSWRPRGDLFVDGLLGYGQMGLDTRRRTPVNQSLVFGERDGAVWFGSLSTGVDRTVGSTRWIGYGRVDLLSADLDAYVETGSPLWALSYEDRGVDSLQGALGLRYERDIVRGDGRWTPGLRVEWSHEFADADAQSLRYADWLDGPGFSISQEGWVRSRLTLGLTLGWTSSSGWSWYTEYEGGFTDEEMLNGLRLKAAKAF